MRPLGDGFIKLVKMIIAPVIFLTVVTGIAGMRDTLRALAATGKIAEAEADLAAAKAAAAKVPMAPIRMSA